MNKYKLFFPYDKNLNNIFYYLHRTCHALSIVLLITILSGCMSLNYTAYKQSSNSAVKNHTLQKKFYLLMTAKKWALTGRIGLESPAQNGSASLNWRQEGDYYGIHLFGPLGIGAVELKGRPGKIMFTNQQGQVFIAASPEALLKQQTTWQLPLSYLIYWIRAQPDPKIVFHQIFNTQHELIRLDQQGWIIHYLSYDQGLPKLMTLQHDQIQVHLVINHWQF